MQRNWITHTLMVGMENGTATVENNTIVSNKKNQCTYHMT